MKRTSNLLVLLWFTLCISVVNCRAPQKSEKEQKLDSDSLIIPSDQLFKSWLNDTLSNFINWEKVENNNIVSKELVVSKDSLSLLTNTYYFTNITRDTELSGKVLNMVDLLKEYDEFPKEDFKLSFLYKEFYYPTSIAQMRYDFIYEINDFQVITNETKSEFQYIRGRLISKKVESTYKKSPSVKIEFIWQGDTIIKKTL